MLVQALSAPVRLVGRDGSVLLAGRIIQNINGFALSVIIVRRFGLGAAGTLALASVAVVLLTLVCALGMPYSLPRDSADIRRKNTFGLLASGVAIVAGLPAVATFGLIFGRNGDESLTIALLALGGFFFAQINILNTLLLLQGRTVLSLVPPCFNSFGVLCAAFYAPGLVELALVLAVARSIGVLLVFATLPYGRLAPGEFLGNLRQGAAYLPMDFLVLSSDQFAMLGLAQLLPRDQLGVIGLCRQVITAADTPGWTFTQSVYPEMVASHLGTLPALERRMLTLSVMCAFAAFLFSALVGVFFYDVPGFALYMLVLLLTLPARYLATLHDHAIRAAGQVRTCNEIALLRFVIALVLLPGAGAIFGLWGAIAAMAALSLVALVLTRWSSMTIVGTAGTVER